jgi:hypothetical protein
MLSKSIERHCTSLAIDPVERVVVVMKDDTARKAPLADVFFDQLARVAAGWKVRWLPSFEISTSR